jgi:hypothetical protein
MGFAYEKHLKKPQTTSSGDVKGSQNKGSAFNKGLLRRWNTLPMKVDITCMDRNVVYILGTFTNAIKIRR